MSIIRAPRPESKFLQISNDILQDKSLSMRSLGMLVRLLSRPDNWKTNSETLAREFNCGRDQVRTVLKELVDSGYMRLEKDRCQETGQWNTHWYVYEEKQPETHFPTPGIQEPGNQVPGNPASGGSGAITNTDLQTTDTKVERVKKPAYHGNGLFDQFWKAYPKKTNKERARKAFDKRKPDEQLLETMTKALNHQKTSVGWLKDNGMYIPNPEAWINGARWEDELQGFDNKPSGAFSGAI